MDRPDPPDDDTVTVDRRADEAERAEPRARPSHRDDKEPAKGQGRDGDGQKKSLIRQHPIAIVVGLVILVAVAIAGTIWWMHARHFESSDDAFIDARTVPISAQVAGQIVDVPVTDNEIVEAGDVLATLDPRDYQAALDQARAQVAQAQASVATFEAQIEAQQTQIEQAQKQVSEAKAALSFAQSENQRYQELVQNGAGTAQRAQQAASDLTQRQAAFASAQAAEAGTQKQVAVLQAQKRSAQAQLEGAQAQLEQAQANWSRTNIRAPVKGRVTKLSAAKGGYATPGQALMMLVPLDVWVTANFKETQLADMHPGQPVSIAVDAYPGRTFAGHVDSVQAGSGTAFSLLPSENATGNYVKVVQRVPVKIVFDQPPDVHLGPGMSVVPQVKVR